jgi:hypothetical protein
LSFNKCTKETPQNIVHDQFEIAVHDGLKYAHPVDAKLGYSPDGHGIFIPQVSNQHEMLGCPALAAV